MGRSPVIQSEKKIRIVLSILAGEMTHAEASCRDTVSEQLIGRCKAEFLEGGRPHSLLGRPAHRVARSS